MNESGFSKQLKNGALQMGVQIDPVMADALYRYMRLVGETNKHMNLTSVQEDEDFLVKHIFDALTLIPYICDGDRVADIGTGAGLPGFVIKIMKPDISLMLLESVEKKSFFLDQVVQSLSLNDVTIVRKRAEEAAHDQAYRQKFDFVSARAVAKLPTLLELCMPFVRVRGHFVAMKSEGATIEKQEAAQAAKLLQAKLEKTDFISLPIQKIPRCLFLYECNGTIASSYPRRVGIPKKRPL